MRRSRRIAIHTDLRDNPAMPARPLTRLCAAPLLILASMAIASPLIEPGDTALRSDIQRLADHGVISGPVSTWPLAWGPVLEDLRDADLTQLPSGVADAAARVRYRAGIETQTNVIGFTAEIGVAEKPSRIRSFQDTPRGDAEVSAGVEWLGDWLSIDINGQAVDGDPQVDEFRADNSMIGVAIGNWSIAASTYERWWGPGWDGSIILGNNARPIPSMTLDRTFPDPFESKWLRWIGPWDLNVTFGQMESDRFIPDARFFGMRFNFRPLRSLEIGLSRTAIWCGDGRPCGVDTFVDLLVGRDNVGDAGIGSDNEPGNQLAGLDIRWTPAAFDRSISFYGQFIGEDEAGGFPSKYMGQLGGEWSGYLMDRWSARAFAEFAGTSCQFHESSEIFDCAYNHGTYRTGYRYRGRVIGHGADNDARLISAGVVLVDVDNTQWRALVRYGKLNRGGSPDARNSLTPTPQDISSIDIAHARRLPIGELDVGVGVEAVDDEATGTSSTDGRFYLHWRHWF